MIRDRRESVCELGESGAVSAALRVYGDSRGTEASHRRAAVELLRLLVAAHHPEGATNEEEGEKDAEQTCLL